MTPNCKHRLGSPAFTLIELLVVVLIIAVLSSLAIPVFSKVSSAGKESLRRSKEAAGESGLPLHIPDGLVPDIESARFDLSLGAADHRLGLEVYTRYQLHCEGTVQVLPTGRSEDGTSPVAIAIPFPRGTEEAWDVQLRIRQGGSAGDGGRSVEPDGVRYDRRGIYWEGAVPEEGSLVGEFTYTALGSDALHLDLPPARRIRSIDVRLDGAGVPSLRIPENSLQPLEAGGPEYRWTFRNLVSDRSLLFELPGAESALGRLGVLFRFMALSVLLFGAGFWYTNEQIRPGSLECFRWGHFLLLASTFCLFFIVFAVIVSNGHLGVWPAVAISGLCSLPLLQLHVTRLTGRRFAYRHILPLAVLSLSVVINGVYGGAARDYVFIALLIVCVAYLTLTYSPPKTEPKRGAFA